MGATVKTVGNATQKPIAYERSQINKNPSTNPTLITSITNDIMHAINKAIKNENTKGLYRFGIIPKQIMISRQF